MTIVSLEDTQAHVRQLLAGSSPTSVATLQAQVATLMTQVAALQAIVTANQTANTVLAGPATGAAAAPTFRALVAADIPA